VSAENDELVALRVRVKELEMERDILKKALGIFSRET
jgi:transposase-like protein